MALATTTGQWPSGVTVAATLAGGVLAIGASGTFNHLYERDRDRQMERTADRPIATDRIPATRAALFGGVQVFLSRGSAGGYRRRDGSRTLIRTAMSIFSQE